jgi:hypothetical protein
LRNRGINLRIILKLVLQKVMKMGAVFVFVGLRTSHIGRILQQKKKTVMHLSVP